MVNYSKNGPINDFIGQYFRTSYYWLVQGCMD